ncbi:MAG: DUF1573 domain-containing protein [Bacteroidetes bacterium]|nr:MAG: DUF1573 domain-containing protein [Bacteroidota bacterium]
MMKKQHLIFIITFFVYIFVNQQFVYAQKASISFEKPVFDLANVEQGTIIEHTFKFSNTGNANLVITEVKTTCGCTATKWSKTAVLAGEKSGITVQFNTEGKIGQQNKIITVFSNASNKMERLTLKANILKKSVR